MHFAISLSGIGEGANPVIWHSDGDNDTLDQHLIEFSSHSPKDTW